MIPRVLVCGDDTRSFLSVVRSLGERGMAVDACPFDFSAPALKSRYIETTFRLPSYNLAPDAWVARMREILTSRSYALIVPCDDRTIIPFRRHRDDLPPVRMAVPNDEAFDAFFDKHNTRTAAIAAGVPVAPGRLLTRDDTAEALIAEFGLPLVIKPRRSYEERNVAQRRNVTIARDEDTARETLDSISARDEFLVEGYFPGYGAGLSVLSFEGRVGPVFQHDRVHEPPSGGGSSYRISIKPDDGLIEYVSALAAETKLHGVGMFEFKKNPETGDIILIEVNARFWGSVPLAIASGVDFPWLLYKQLVDGEEAPRTPYRIGYYGRAFHNDVNCINGILSEKRREGAMALAGEALGILGGLTRPLIGKESHDSFSWNDLKPALAEYGGVCTDVLGALDRRLLGARVRTWQRLGLARRKLRQRDKSRRLSVLFMCFGNICRSPYAAALFRDKARRFSVEVDSGGFLEVNGRRSPHDALRAAKRWNADLTNHRSKCLMAEEIARFDLVVLFDEKNEAAFRALGLDPEPAVVRMGDFLPGFQTGAVIEDPYKRGTIAFETSYKAISEAIDGLTDFLDHKLDRDDVVPAEHQPAV